MLKIFFIILLIVSLNTEAKCKVILKPNELLKELEGFCIVFTEKALPKNDVEFEKVLELLQSNIKTMNLIAPKLSMIKSHATIWVTNFDWQPSAMVTHFSPDWLKENKMDERMAVGIEITNTKNFLKWSVKGDQPLMLFHEAAHVFHYVLLGDKKILIEEAFQTAVKDKKYEKVDYHHGKAQLKAYAINNAFEYFAELTEAYFGDNDYYPYTKNDLKNHDPKAFKILSEIYN